MLPLHILLGEAAVPSWRDRCSVTIVGLLFLFNDTFIGNVVNWMNLEDFLRVSMT